MAFVSDNHAKEIKNAARDIHYVTDPRKFVSIAGMEAFANQNETAVWGTPTVKEFGGNLDKMAKDILQPANVSENCKTIADYTR